nr:MAG TPA: cysteine-rich protein [Caudoviricetes sp.]
MIKLINGCLWFCCPLCGQKLHKIAPDAVCSGVTTHCKRCRWEGEINIGTKKGA